MAKNLLCRKRRIIRSQLGRTDLTCCALAGSLSRLLRSSILCLYEQPLGRSFVGVLGDFFDGLFPSFLHQRLADRLLAGSHDSAEDRARTRDHG